MFQTMPSKQNANEKEEKTTGNIEQRPEYTQQGELSNCYDQNL